MHLLNVPPTVRERGQTSSRHKGKGEIRAMALPGHCAVVGGVDKELVAEAAVDWLLILRGAWNASSERGNGAG